MCTKNLEDKGEEEIIQTIGFLTTLLSDEEFGKDGPLLEPQKINSVTE